MSSTSLRSFYRETFEPLFLRSRSERTKNLYNTTINTFERFLGRTAELSDLTDDTVGKFLYWFRQQGRAPASVNKERSNLLAIWRFACRKGYIQLWPDVQPEVDPERVPQAWTESEIRRLFLSIRREPGWIAGIRAADWWHALHLLAWDTGERITAIVSLRWCWVSLADATVLIPAEVRKGKRKDRLYRLSPDTVAALNAIRLPQRDLVLPWPLNRTYLWRRYEPILKRAGLPCDRRSKFHRMRRSVASHYEAAGGDATEFLGHSARKVTRAYLDPRIVGDRQASDVLFRPPSPRSA
jgi:integrase